MLMTVDELRTFITTEETDSMLEARLLALELSIRRYTNNTFTSKAYRIKADIRDGVFMSESMIPFKVGDTIMVSSDLQSDCLAVVKEIAGTSFNTESEWADEDNVIVTRVVYPADVKLGVANILKWQLKNEAAAMGDRTAKPVQSETLSRYSVTYAADASESDLDSSLGVPKKLTAFLKMHRKARF